VSGGPLAINNEQELFVAQQLVNNKPALPKKGLCGSFKHFANT
jgi:hypothetical protein